jgi:hypothetical protein
MGKPTWAPQICADVVTDRDFKYEVAFFEKSSDLGP